MPVLKFMNDINQFDVKDFVADGAVPRITGIFPPFPLDHFKAPTGLNNVWIGLGFAYYQPVDQHFMRVTDQDGREILTFGASGTLGSGGTLGLRVLGATVAVTQGIADGMEYAGTKRMDMHVDVVAGTVKVYIEAVLVASFTGALTGVTSIGGYSWRAHNTQTTAWGLDVAYAFIANEDTRPIFMQESYPTANGAVQQWAGDETLIDGFAIDDGNVLVSNTAEQTSVFVTGDLPTTFAAGYAVMAFGVSARARVVGVTGGPRSLAVAARSGTALANGETVALSPGFKNYQSMLTLDPNTSAAWTYASINAAQIGVTSKA
jgi:hypothetical protein